MDSQDNSSQKKENTQPIYNCYLLQAKFPYSEIEMNSINFQFIHKFLERKWWLLPFNCGSTRRFLTFNYTSIWGFLPFNCSSMWRFLPFNCTSIWRFLTLITPLYEGFYPLIAPLLLYVKVPTPLCLGTEMVVLPAVLYLHLPDGDPLRPHTEGDSLYILQKGKRGQG